MVWHCSTAMELEMHLESWKNTHSLRQTNKNGSPMMPNLVGFINGFRLYVMNYCDRNKRSVLRIWIVKSNVWSVGPSSERSNLSLSL